MTRLVVVRPEPGNAATTARARGLGFDVLSCPLFAVRPVAWTAPAPDTIDALLVTSANAIRHGGAPLATLEGLPVVAVGAASARAAAGAGFAVAATGTGDARAAAALARRLGFERLFHPAGRDHVAVPGVERAIVYASEPIDLPPGCASSWGGRTVLVHSSRTARRIADLVARDGIERSVIGIAAISAAAAAAAGPGWRAVAVAAEPTDAALIAAAGAAPD